MPTKTEEHLDTDELFHLALTATQQGKSEEAITLLKRALTLSPNDARLHYMLGAEHAQIGLYDRATEEMQRAVELNPTLETAHFQLGLLHMTAGRTEAAVKAWAPLDQLSHDHFLYLFKTGLQHLVKDEFAECQEHLRRGIGANTVNAALNNDMARVLKDVDDALANAPKKDGAPAKAGQKHVLLSTYQKNRDPSSDH